MSHRKAPNEAAMHDKAAHDHRGYGCEAGTGLSSWRFCFRQASSIIWIALH
jgi:hypothetical protein